MRLMNVPRWIAIEIAIAVALGGVTGHAAGGDDEEAPAANPVDVAIPFHAVHEVPMGEGWLVEDCASLTAPAGIIFTCEPDGMTFAAAEYDPGFAKTAFPVALVNGNQRLVVTYTVSQAPPAAPLIAEALDYPYPFPAGSRVLLPYSDLAIGCEGCAGTGPTVTVLGVEPAAAGSARATSTHLELMPTPGYVGPATVGFTLEDSFGQESAVGSVAVSFYAAGAAPLTALHAVMEVDDGSLEIDLGSLVSTADGGEYQIIGSGPPVLGTLDRNDDGTLHYLPPADWAGVDQFAFHVLAANGEQATGSVTLVDPLHARDLAPGLLISMPVDGDATIVPTAPVTDDDAQSPGLFASLQQVLDRLTGRVEPATSILDEETK